MTEQPTLAEQLAGLSDVELLAELNDALARRKQPPTDEDVSAQAARDEDAEYRRYFPEDRR